MSLWETEVLNDIISWQLYLCQNKILYNQKSSVEEIWTLYILGILRIDILVILKKIQVPTHSELELTTLNSAESVGRTPMDQITPAKKFLKSLKLRESITLFRGLESKPHSGKEECAHSHTYTLQSHTYSSHGIAAYIKITSDCRRYSTTIFHYRIFSFIFNKTHFLSGTGDGLGVKKL